MANIKLIRLLMFLSLFFFLSFTACDQNVDDDEMDETEVVDTTDIVLEDTNTYEEDDKSARPSPPDSAVATINGMTVKVNYGSPGVKGRKIWGDLVPYNKVWRTGANEATTFNVNQDVMINGQKLPAGKYGFFTIPGQNEWTVIFNSIWDQWGAFDYDESKDVLRIKVNPKKTEEMHERMSFEINEKDGNTAEVKFFWENVTWSFDVKPAT